MELYYSELCLLGQDVFQNVHTLASRGISHIELMMDGTGWNTLSARIEETAAALRALRIPQSIGYSVHAPVWDANLAGENSFLRGGTLAAVKEALRFSYLLGALHLVVHPGLCHAPSFDKDAARCRALDLLHQLAAYNRQFGVRLLMENVGTNATSLFTEDEYSTFLDEFPPEFGYILDVGHANINGWDLPNLIRRTGDRLYAFHLHDNGGIEDSHLPIGEGTINWDTLFTVLRGMTRRPVLVLEYNIGTPLEKLAEGKKILEDALV
jgi:sugar phosphate isomerase/epimerase